MNTNQEKEKKPSVKKQSQRSMKILTTKPDSSSEMVKAIPIPESPFVARMFEDKWILTCGNYRTQDIYSSYEACEAQVKNPTWDMIMICMQFVIDFKNDTLNTK